MFTVVHRGRRMLTVSFPGRVGHDRSSARKKVFAGADMTVESSNPETGNPSLVTRPLTARRPGT